MPSSAGGRCRAPDALHVPWDELAAALARGTRLEELGIGEDEPTPGGSRHVACQVGARYHGRIQDWVADIRRAREQGETVLFVAATPGRAERTLELLREYDVIALPVDAAEVTRGATVLVATGSLSAGFRLADAGLQIVAEADVFEEERIRRERRTGGRPSEDVRRSFFSDFRDLKVGDHVVHVDHGIGVFVGLKKLSVGLEIAGVHGAPLRRRGQALRPRRTARSGPEVLGRRTAARSIGSAAPPGRRPRRASRRRCATWPTSC